MISLYSTTSSSKSISGIVVFTSLCPCWTSGTGWLQLSFVLCFSSYFALFSVRSPSVRYALLLAVGFALLGSFHHRSRFSCSSRCPRTLVALLSSSHHWLVGCGSVSDSHHLLLGCGSVGDSLTTGSLAVVPSVLLLQSHFVVSYDSVARFWLHPNITTQRFALRVLMVRGRCPRCMGKQLKTTFYAFVSVSYFATRRCSPLPLCGVLDCVHLHNEGLHRGLLSLRGPLFLPTLLGVIDPRVSFFRLAVTENRCHCHTLLLFTCSDDFFSLWSSSLALQRHSHRGRLRLRVLFLTLLSGATHASEFLLCDTHRLLNEEPFFTCCCLSAQCGRLLRAPSLFPCGAPSFC